MTAAGWVLVGGWWRKTVKGQENCDDPEVAAQIIAGLEAEVNAALANLGGQVNMVVIDPLNSGHGCIEVGTQQQCTETGTFHAGQLCEDNVCL